MAMKCNGGVGSHMARTTTRPSGEAWELRLTDAADRRALLDRLARIAGQIEGVRKMIEREESCEKVAQQLAAARAALNKAFAELLARIVERNCLAAQGDNLDPETRCRLEAISQILTKYA